jgi:hypothetical protein
MKEQWKPVKGFEGAYEVSNLGRVRSHYDRRDKNHLMTPYDNARGYLRVALRLNGVLYNKYLHIIVAEAFIPNPLGLPEVNHLGAQSDCRASMLEWRSTVGNSLHRQQHDGKGVRFDKRRGKWVASYSPFPNKLKWIGTFNTEEEAREARRKAVATIPYVL